VQVKSRLDLILYPPGWCARHETLTVSDRFTDAPAQLESIGIRERPLRLEVNINKKFKNFRLLFNDIESGPARNIRQVSLVKGVQIGVGHVKLPAIHEDVRWRVRTLSCPSLDKHDSLAFLISINTKKGVEYRLYEGLEGLLCGLGLGLGDRLWLLPGLDNLFNFVVHLHDGHGTGKRLGVRPILPEVGEALGNGNL
jgi:hypothetical protein